MQYTIESRQLSSDASSQRTFVEASDENEAISRYVSDSAAELVSFTTPPRGAESIATVKKEDRVFLVRVYTA
jgi:hypothetical protein